jgi:hypothetical protein
MSYLKLSKILERETCTCLGKGQCDLNTIIKLLTFTGYFATLMYPNPAETYNEKKAKMKRIKFKFLY